MYQPMRVGGIERCPPPCLGWAKDLVGGSAQFPSSFDALLAPIRGQVQATGVPTTDLVTKERGRLLTNYVDYAW